MAWLLGNLGIYGFRVYEDQGDYRGPYLGLCRGYLSYGLNS